MVKNGFYYFVVLKYVFFIWMFDKFVYILVIILYFENNKFFENFFVKILYGDFLNMWNINKSVKKEMWLMWYVVFFIYL